MANKSFIVQYLIKARDAFSRDTNRAAKSFDNLDKKSKKAARGFKRSSAAFTKGFKQMAAAAIAFFSVRSFLTVGSQFQTALANLSAITGATGDDLDSLRDKTLQMSKQFIISQTEVATAIKLVASAKPELLGNLDALTATTEQVLLLSNAAGIDLAQAALVTTESLNQFGKGAESAGEFVNILAAGAKLGSSEIRDTGAAAVIAGPGARAAGLSFLQLNAAIQVTAKGGIKAEKAGTALNAIFGRLRRLGFDFQKLGLQGTFEQVKKVLDGVTDNTKRAQLEAKLFGEEHGKVGLAILSNVTMLGQYERSLAGTNIAQEQANINLDTFAKRSEKLKIVINDALIKTFLRLEPELSKLTEDFAVFLEGIDTAQLNAFADSLKIVAGSLQLIGFFAKEALGILKGVGEIIGQVVASIVTLDFSQFDLGDAFRIGSASLTGPTLEPATGLAGAAGRVDVGINVGLDEGLTQTTAPTVNSSGTRRADVGTGTVGI